MTMPKEASDNDRDDSRIAVAYFLDRYGKGGGTENQLATLLRSVDKTRFSSYLISLRPAESSSSIDVDCPTYSLGVTSLLSFRAVIGIWRLAQLLRKLRINVLQIYFTDSNIFGVVAGRLAGIKNIVVNRRDMGMWYGTSALKWTNILNRFTRYCLANAESVKQLVMKVEPFTSDQVRVIYNGVDMKAPVGSLSAPEDLVTPDSARVVGIVSNLKAIKRVEMFLRVSQRLKSNDTHFVIVGVGPDKEKLIAQAEAAGMADRVTFYETVDHVFEVMSLFDVGVLTSRTEGLSNVLIEYALSEVPAVAFDVGGNREVISDSETGYIIPEPDEVLMAERIDQLLEDGEMRLRLGKRAGERAQERFSRRKMVAQVENFYQEIVNSGA